MLHFFDPACEEFRPLTRDEPSAFAPPPAFGPFRVLHQVGVGALGPVFRTYEPTRDRLIAVKVLRLDVTPEQAQSLAEELSHATEASLFHPSIVEPIAAGVQGTVAYRAEEYVAAESLDVAMRHYAPSTLEKALPFITQLAGAIDFARAVGVGHGALHPRDIFITPDEARVGGFGVVDALERVGLRAPVRRPYTAPERIAGTTWSTPADVFSLAAITFELLTGRRPAGIGSQIGALSGSNLGAHENAIHAVLARAMDDDPARRFASALEFAAALEAASRGVQAAAPAAAAVAAQVAPAVPPRASGNVTSQFAEGDEEAPAEDNILAYPRTPPRHEAPPPTDVRAFDPEAKGPIALDDVDVEREEDEAHHAVLEAEQREREALEPEEDSELFADESEPDRFVHVEDDDLPLTDAAAENRPVAATVPPPQLPFEPSTLSIPERASPVPVRGEMFRTADTPPPTEPREGTRMLPLAGTLMLGLLLGFAAGYVVAGRDRAAQTSASAVTPRSEQASSTASQQPTSGRDYSEQEVAPSTGSRGASRAQPPAAAPPVPGEGATQPQSTAGRAAASVRGRLVVQSSPSRANVTVNGRWRGRTPLTLANLPLGPYSLRVVRNGFNVAREQVTLSSAQASRTITVKLQPTRTTRAEPEGRPEPSSTTGVLFVDSRPRGAQVFIDGRLVGTTPMRLPDIAIGSHVVRLELKGHNRWSASTTISSGREARVTGSLEPIR